MSCEDVRGQRPESAGARWGSSHAAPPLAIGVLLAVRCRSLDFEIATLSVRESQRLNVYADVVDAARGTSDALEQEWFPVVPQLSDRTEPADSV